MDSYITIFRRSSKSSFARPLPLSSRKTNRLHSFQKFLLTESWQATILHQGTPSNNRIYIWKFRLQRKTNSER